jgi:hypothetical protein
VRSDNKGAIGAHNKGCSPNVGINLCVRRTYAISAGLAITPNIIYVPTDDNLADTPSRGESTPHTHAIASHVPFSYLLSSVSFSLTSSSPRFEHNADTLAFGDLLLTLAASLVPRTSSLSSPLGSSPQPDLFPFSYVPSRIVYAHLSLTLSSF